MREHLAILLALPLAAAGCNKDTPSGPSAPSASPPVATAVPTAAKTTVPAAVTVAAPVLRAAPTQKSDSPVVAAYKTDKTTGTSVVMTFDFSNKGKKDVKTVYYKACAYDTSGKRVDPTPSSGVDVAVKAGATAQADVTLDQKQLGPSYAVGLAITGVKFADNTSWEDKTASCADRTKP